MEVEFLLIGKGLTGQIKRCDYPKDKLRVTELTVESANEPAIVRPVLVFDVVQHKYDGKTYAIAIGASSDSVQINALIDRLKPQPIPESLLIKGDPSDQK
ncbi:TPA: hypothetical protein R6322_002661 [Klebsiella pneumoniae]|uniref:hypothetical protein n=1 Tax=Klebsiella pneumoniae TaxID=573 RepID=UPI0006525802|nr:hypothetical protein [Klebsiella pneumoniae]HBT4583544.1 hypothetical protein [Klebsiella pneumoniae]HBT9090133.1 hypothetical protein [Klebsiella pneumoniae]HCF8100890.1 hypothetical protein [Klebsiella pneumoniae]HEE0472634.1 hypothetical protein [Klebsiella pneumoniae]